MKIIWGKTLSLFLLCTFLFNTVSPAIVFAQDAVKGNKGSAEPVGQVSEIPAPTDTTTDVSTEPPVNKNNKPAKETILEPTQVITETSAVSTQLAATATSSTTTESPGPGEIKSPDNPININASYQTSLFTGSATYEYSIPVPPGTNGLTPEIKLSYNSMGASGKAGIFGLGWDLNLSYVYRDVNFTPTNTADDNYKLVLNGSSYDLIYDSVSQLYKTKVQTDIFIKKLTGATNRYGEYWQVITKDGTNYRLGYNLNAEANCETVSSPKPWSERNYARSWYLDEVTDVNGNKIYYSYKYNIDSSDLGAIYPSKIEYNNDKIRKIEFVPESYTRTDSGIFYEQGACRVVQNRRIDKVNIYYNNVLKNTFDITFSNTDSSKSLLSQIVQISPDLMQLPPTKFEYNLLKTGFSDSNREMFTYTGFQLPKDWRVGSNYINQVRWMDINRDFLPDFVLSNGDYSTTPLTSRNWEIYLNNGSGWNNKQVWATYGVPSLNDGTKAYSSGDYLVNLVDMNLDGLTDIYVVDSAKTNTKTPANGIWFYPNNGTKFSQIPTQITSPNSANFFVSDNRYIDFNNDNLIDYLRARCFDLTNCLVYFNQNGSFAPEVDINPSNTLSVTGAGKIFIDVNDDSLTDIVTTNAKNWYVYLSNGLGWEDYQIWNTNVNRTVDCVETCDKQPYLLDMDGDNLPELIEIYEIPFSNGKYELRVHKNTGKEWENNFVIWHTRGKISNYGSNYLRNINYDSLPEMRYASEEGSIGGGSGYLDVDKNPNHASLLLNKITNTLGGTTEIEYTPSTKFDNTGGDGISDLGFPVYSVTKITENDGVNPTTEATTYAYKNGLYDYVDREFRGFGQVTSTNSEGTITEHYFKQDDALKGNEYKTIVKDTSGKLYQEAQNIWSSVLTSGIYTNRLITSDSFSYDGVNTNPKQTRVTYEYDSYGNVTKEKNWGDMSVTGDEMTTTTSYVYNLAKWILNKPKNTFVTNSLNLKVKEGWFYYDNNTDNNAVPEKGLLTKEEQWNDSGENFIQKYEYNSYGNITKNINPLDQASLFEYDATNTFQTKITNPKNQIINITYDSASGNKLSETDSNGLVKSYVYDSFGRVVKEILPYDSTTYPTLQYQYFTDGIAPEMVKVSKRENSAQVGTIDTYTFVDGFGRVIQTRSEAEDPAKHIVTGFVYNGFGKVEKQILPYIENASQVYTTSSPSLKSVSINFDPIGRVTKVTNPDNTFQTFGYDHWKLTLTDANNHKKVQYLNAYNQITKVEEYLSSSVFNTLYEYQFPDGNVTKITDDKGSQIKFEYDSLGRNTKLTDHSLGTWIYTYDALGNMLTQRDNRGVTISTTYDVLNRPVLINYPNDKDISFIYDREKIGTLSEITDAVGVTKYTYDNRLRTIKEEKTVITQAGSKTLNKTFTTENGYDSADRVVSIKYPVQVGATVGETKNYTFNNQGQIETMNGLLANINYNQLNKITRKDFGNTLSTIYTYNNTTERLGEIKTSGINGNSLQNFKYSYDKVGNVNSIQDVIKATTQMFTYDDLDRLVTATEVGSYDYTYKYDSVGNILSVNTQDGLIEYYYEDSLRPNILTKILGSKPTIVSQSLSLGNSPLDLFTGSGSALSGTGSEDLIVDSNIDTTQENNNLEVINTYDNNGNLVSDNTFCYQYNDANKISKVKKCSDGSLIAKYIYDSAGQRAIKQIYNNGAFVKVTVDIGDFYDYTLKANGTAKSNTYYKANNELIAKRTVVQSPSKDEITYYHNDHLGSASLVTSSTGAKVEETRYYPYGEVREGGTQKLTGKYTYTGQESDGETGLMYYGARYYDAGVGRFVQPDSMLPNMYDVQQLNRYVYVKNNPLKYTDPTGNCATGLVVDTGACVVGGAAVSASLYAVGIVVTAYTIACLIDCDTTNENIGKVVDTTAAKIGEVEEKAKQVQQLVTLELSNQAQNVADVTKKGVAGILGVVAAMGMRPDEKQNDDNNISSKRNPKQDKRLTKGEVDSLEKKGYDIHKIKKEYGTNSHYDLFKDSKGEIYLKPKNGAGPGESININLYE